MLVVFTSLTDPELSLLSATAGVAVVVPAHLSQPGWVYSGGCGAAARLVTSKGALTGGDVLGVLTRIARPSPTELRHIVPDDREYVASEMTAFVAALLNDLPRPVLNPPTANCWYGPPWSAERWQRAAAAEDLAICRDQACDGDDAAIVSLDGAVVRRSHTLDARVESRFCRAASRSGAPLLEGRFCRRHAAFRSISLRPRLDAALLNAIEQYCRKSECR